MSRQLNHASHNPGKVLTDEIRAEVQAINDRVTNGENITTVLASVHRSREWWYRWSGAVEFENAKCRDATHECRYEPTIGTVVVGNRTAPELVAYGIRRGLISRRGE